MSLAACIEHMPVHYFGEGYRCSRCGAPASPRRFNGMLVVPDPSLPLNRIEIRDGEGGGVAANLSEDERTDDV